MMLLKNLCLCGDCNSHRSHECTPLEDGGYLFHHYFWKAHYIDIGDTLKDGLWN